MLSHREIVINSMSGFKYVCDSLGIRGIITEHNIPCPPMSAVFSACAGD